MFSSLYLPPLPEGSAFEDFQEIIARLRAPDGCPWDREQTHASLKPYMLEEAYEALEALDEEDMESLKEELGDVLLQVFLHAQIATEDQDFKISDVVQVASSKLIRRHPHVFGETAVQDVEGVIQNWERIKADERQENDKKPDQGMLDGIPLSLPALTQADAIQRRARRVGFDWPDISGVIQKIDEELDELKAAPDSEARRAESGDLLFAVVNLIRWLDIDSESALRECNKRFRRRFSFIEHSAAHRGVSLASMSFEEMDALWEQAKTLEDPSHNPTTA
jgi:tetrapyrrole methylase family protein/MazG family protein